MSFFFRRFPFVFLLFFFCDIIFVVWTFFSFSFCFSAVLMVVSIVFFSNVAGRFQIWSFCFLGFLLSLGNFDLVFFLLSLDLARLGSARLDLARLRSARLGLPWLGST